MANSPDYFGLSDRIKALNAPAGLDAVHKPGYSWAVQGQYYSDTTKIGAPDWNAVIAQFRGLLTIDGVDLTDLSASSPLILREALVRSVAAKITTSLPGAVADQIDDLEALLAGDADFVDAVSAATNLTAAEKAKLAYLAVTGAIDLDWVKSRLTALNSAQVFRGGWNASSGAFPGGGNAANGDVYTADTAGTVDGVDFEVGDRISAITNNASTTTFVGNWFKEDYTDKVASVAGLVGAISASDLKSAIGGGVTPSIYDTAGSFTWTKPAGLSDEAIVEVDGWGGGGGGATGGSPAAGGGGGSYAPKVRLRAGDLPSTVTVTVGAGGATGVDGGDSSFGAHLTAYGGAKGTQGGGGGHGGGSMANGNGALSGFDTGGSGASSAVNATGSYYGGGGGGYGGSHGTGGSSVWGGGGAGVGAAAGGSSNNGGQGGSSGGAATAPGGGGYYQSAGAGGMIRVWVIE